MSVQTALSAFPVTIPPAFSSFHNGLLSVISAVQTKADRTVTDWELAVRLPMAGANVAWVMSRNALDLIDQTAYAVMARRYGDLSFAVIDELAPTIKVRNYSLPTTDMLNIGVSSAVMLDIATLLTDPLTIDATMQAQVFNRLSTELATWQR
jgi:hypothetical protein